MCKGIKCDAPDFLTIISMLETLDVSSLTHPTVENLSLNNSKYAACNLGHTYSITSHNTNTPTISKSELVIL